MEHLNSWSLIISWSQVCMWTPASLLDLDMYCWSGPCSGGQKVVLGLMKIRGRSSSPIRLTSFTRDPAAANTRSSSSWEPIRGEHRGSANHSSPRWGRRCLCAPPPAAAPCGCAWARAGRRGSGGCRRGWGGRRPRWGRGPCAGPTLRLKVGKYYF